jgi:hypothetical protein
LSGTRRAVSLCVRSPSRSTGADALVGIWGLSCDRAGFQGGRIKRVIVALVRVPTGVTADGLAPLANNFAHALLRIDTAPLAAS